MRINISHFWGAAALLLPFYIRANSYNDIKVSKSYLFIGMVVLSLMLFGCDRAKPLIAAPVIGLATLIQFNQNDFYSDAGIEQLVCVLAGLLLVYQLSTRALEWSVLRIYLGITNFLTSFVVILNVFGFNPYNPSVPPPYPVGPLGQQTISGALIAMTLPALFQGIGWLAVPAALIGLYYCGSAMSWASAVAATLVFISYRTKKVVPFLVTSCLVLLAAVAKFAASPFLSAHGRLEIWAGALQRKNFTGLESLFGKGLGDFWDNFHDHYFMRFIDDRIVRQAHSEPIQLFWEVGFIGCALIVWMLCPVFQDLRYKNAFVMSALAATIVNSLANFTFHIAPLALLGVLFYSMSLRRET